MSMIDPIRLAVLVSGGGSNLEAILEAIEKGEIPGATVELVISNKDNVLALERARKHQVEAIVIDSRSFARTDLFDAAMIQVLLDYHIDVICLAGYLKKLGADLVDRFRGRILNIHPALLPKFGGPGMYGHYVHEAVLQAAEKESGCTVHLVDEEFDHGRILAQVRVPVLPDDTPATLAARILEEEHQIYPRTIREFCAQFAMQRRKAS